MNDAAACLITVVQYSEIEEFVDETHFACDAGLQQDALAFPDHPHHLEAFDGGVGRFHRLEPERRSAQPLDRAVVALDAVVEVFRLTVPDGLNIRITPLQLPQRFAIGANYSTGGQGGRRAAAAYDD